MTLYSYNSAYPTPLPFRITLSNSKTRTDPSTFTTEELIDAGYILADEPPLCSYPNKLEWINNTWAIRVPNETEIAQQWETIRSIRNDLLAASDVAIIRAYENNIAVSDDLKNYRQALRDITIQTNPWSVEWPVLGVTNGT